MKIVEIISEIDNELNGVANSAPNLTLELSKIVDNISIYTFSNNTDRWKSLKVKVFSFWGKELNNSFQFSPQLYNELKKNIKKIDIIHCHGTRVFPFVAPFYINRSTSDCKIVISPRGSLCDFILNKNSKKKFISDYLLGNLKALKNADMFHATSYQEYEEIRRLGLKQPVAIVSNGIVPNVQERVLCKKEKTLIFLSRIDKKKNIETLLNAWNKIQNEFFDWKLNIVGMGTVDYFESLQDLSKNLNNERVNFLGGVKGKQKNDLLANSSLFILPTYNENFGNVVVEALSNETPVITTTGTPWKQLVDQKCGWWIPCDVISVVECLRTAMSMPLEDLHTMGKNGRNWINEEFSWKLKAQQMNLAYQWLTGNIQEKPDFVLL